MQDFVVAGGFSGLGSSTQELASVLVLKEKALNWTDIHPLPQPMMFIHASIVGSRLRVTDGGSQVTVDIHAQFLAFTL